MTDWERIRVRGEEVLGKVKELIREGNVRRVVIKQGARTVAEFPLTVGLVGAVAAPLLAAVGALTALLTECTLEVERETPPAAEAAKGRAADPARKRGRKKGTSKKARG